MEKKKLSLIDLHTELKAFGLNPSEWSLKKIQQVGFLIQNKLDRNFALYGKIEYRDKKPQWVSVEVISL